MSMIYEQSQSNFVDEDIYSILEKYKQQKDPKVVLKELINSSYLIMQKLNIQNSFVSSSKFGSFDIQNPTNADALESMRRLANSVRVQKVSKIDLNTFYSLETSLVLSSIDNKDVYVNISFLRHNQVVGGDANWNGIEYSIFYGENLDSMSNLLKLAFNHKGDERPSNTYGFEAIEVNTQPTSEPEMEEESDDLSITTDLGNLDPPDLSVSEVDSDVEESEELLVRFTVNEERKQQLCALLAPQIPADTLMMSFVSLEFWETNWNIDDRVYELLTDKPIFTEDNC